MAPAREHSMRRSWVGAACLVSCVMVADAGVLTYKHKHVSWVYGPTDYCEGSEESPCGPNQWHTIPGSEQCEEKGTQSPINIESHNVLPVTISDVTLHVKGECNQGLFEINEHTTEVKIQDVCPDVFSLTYKGKKFTLLQLHFHSPSEHTIDGEYYPAEVHMVHMADDGQALPLGVMIGVSDVVSDPGEFIRELHVNMPRYTPDLADANYIEEPREFFNMNPYERILPADSRFFAYSGAFTTPPCTSGTQWLLAMTPVTMSQATLDEYRQMINELPDHQLAPFPVITGLSEPQWDPKYMPHSYDLSLGSNNRPIQVFTGAQNSKRAVSQVEVRLEEDPPVEEYPTSDTSTEIIVIVGLMVLAMAIGMILWLYWADVPRVKKAPAPSDEKLADIVPGKNSGSKKKDAGNDGEELLTF